MLKIDGYINGTIKSISQDKVSNFILNKIQLTEGEYVIFNDEHFYFVLENYTTYIHHYYSIIMTNFGNIYSTSEIGTDYWKPRFLYPYLKDIDISYSMINNIELQNFIIKMIQSINFYDVNTFNSSNMGSDDLRNYAYTNKEQYKLLPNKNSTQFIIEFLKSMIFLNKQKNILTPNDIFNKNMEMNGDTHFYYNPHNYTEVFKEC